MVWRRGYPHPPTQRTARFTGSRLCLKYCARAEACHERFFIRARHGDRRHVRNLRAKLQNDWRKPRFIATVPGKGYRFIPTFSDPERAS
jgi:hypothetical protein